MPQVQAAQKPGTSEESATSGRYSKRKRAQVDYREDDSDGSGEYNPAIERADADSKAKKQKAERAPRPLPKRKIFPFLTLPAEIRNMIYEYALTDDQGVSLASTTTKFRRTVERKGFHELSGDRYRRHRWGYYSQRRPQAPSAESSQNEPQKIVPFVPSLLAVNHQVWQEARGYLYGNDFFMEDPITLHSFIVDIGPRAASWLKKITLVNWGRYRSQQKAFNHSCFAVLITATNLESLTISGSLYTCGGKSAAKQIYRDGFPWLEAVGAAKGRIDAAVDLITVSSDNFKSWHSKNSEDPEADKKNAEEFKEELSKFLNAHMNRIRAKPGKRSTK